MTASAANGFAQVNLRADAATCSESPYTFHPMYSTSSEHTRVPWAAHTLQRRVLRRDRPLRVLRRDRPARAATAPTTARPRLDDDDTGCFSRGVLAPREDRRVHRHRQRLRRDVVPDRSGRGRVRCGAGRDVHPRSSCSRARSSTVTQNYRGSRSRRICRGSRRPTSAGICDRFTGRELQQPAAGIALLPLLHDRDGQATSGRAAASSRACLWQLGGAGIKGTTNTSAATRRTSSGHCSSASTRLRTRRRAGGRTTSATCSSSNPCPA